MDIQHQPRPPGEIQEGRPTHRLRELEEVMVRHVQEALDLRLAGVSALMGKVLSA